MPQLDFETFPTQVFWLVVSFVLLYVLMRTVALPRIEKIIEERRGRLDEDLEKAAQMKTEAEAVIAAYEKALAEARANAQATVKATVDRIAAASAERQRQAAAVLAEKTNAAEARIAAAKADALRGVRDVAVEVAQAMAQRLTGATPETSRAAAAVDAVLQERG
jgi:F-type H+-transporting ATPase subunit b